MSNAATFDTRTDTAIPVESPLAYSYRRSGAPQAGGPSRLQLRERAMLGHLILRGGAIVLDEAVRDVLGISLPGQPQALVQDASGERSIQEIGRASCRERV